MGSRGNSRRTTNTSWNAATRPPLFTRAREHGGITAWVCENDRIARYALDFLAEKGVRVPRAVSVMGFDDDMEAFKRKLTSYNFNIPAVVNRMLGFVLSSSQYHYPKAYEVEGIVIERGTTGKRASGQSITCSRTFKTHT
jgi:DNA-binding LacI/PurR family transcriptional regulator